jgi:hypothetical protein
MRKIIFLADLVYQKLAPNARMCLDAIITVTDRTISRYQPLHKRHTMPIFTALN